MKKIILVLLFLALLITGCSSSNSSYPASSGYSSYDGGSSIERAADNCCKHCTKGKACGDSCININYNCSKAPGCACDY